MGFIMPFSAQERLKAQGVFAPVGAAALNVVPLSYTPKDRDYCALHTPTIPTENLKARRPFRIFLTRTLVLTTVAV